MASFQLTPSAKKNLLRVAKLIVPELLQRRVLQDGKYGIGLRGGMLDFEDLSALLYNAFPFADSVSSTDRVGLVHKAIFQEIQNQTFDGESLVARLVEHYLEYLNSPFEKFVFLTYISLDTMRSMPEPRSVDNCEFAFHRSWPRGFTRDKLQTPFTRLNIPLYTENNWATVTCHTYARNATECGSRGLDALNYLRALWNFGLNYRRGYFWSSPVEVPANGIRIGPVHSMHTPDGDLATELFFFEQPFAHSGYPGRPMGLNERELASMGRIESQLRERIEQLRYAYQFKNLMREYVSILDTPSTEGGLIRLWKVLEALTGTENADYDTLIERASAVFINSEIASVMLEQLRHARNITTHELRSEIDVRICFQQLLRFVHKLVFVHINWPDRFKSLGEAGTFMSLAARGKETLCRQQFLTGHALELLFEKETEELESDFSI